MGYIKIWVLIIIVERYINNPKFILLNEQEERRTAAAGENPARDF